MRNVSGKKKAVEKIKTHFRFNNILPKNRAVYETVWKNIVEPGRPQMTIRRMRITCWIPKATNTHSRNMQYLLLFYCKNGCTNASQCCVMRTLPVTEKMRVNESGNRVLKRILNTKHSTRFK